MDLATFLSADKNTSYLNMVLLSFLKETMTHLRQQQLDDVVLYRSLIKFQPYDFTYGGGHTYSLVVLKRLLAADCWVQSLVHGAHYYNSTIRRSMTLSCMALSWALGERWCMPWDQFRKENTAPLLWQCFKASACKTWRTQTIKDTETNK